MSQGRNALSFTSRWDRLVKKHLFRNRSSPTHCNRHSLKNVVTGVIFLSLTPVTHRRKCNSGCNRKGNFRNSNLGISNLTVTLRMWVLLGIYCWKHWVTEQILSQCFPQKMVLWGSRITFLLLAVTKIRNPGTRYSPKKFPSRSMIHLQIQAYESSTVDWFIGLVVDHYGSGEFPWVNTPSLTPYPIIHKNG